MMVEPFLTIFTRSVDGQYPCFSGATLHYKNHSAKSIRRRECGNTLAVPPPVTTATEPLPCGCTRSNEFTYPGWGIGTYSVEVTAAGFASKTVRVKAVHGECSIDPIGDPDVIKVELSPE